MTQRTRYNWGKTHAVVPELDLVGLQRASYQEFLSTGIAEALAEVTGQDGIEDYTGKSWALRFGQYRFGEPKYSPAEAKRKGVTYDMPLYVQAELLNKKTGTIQEQEVFLGDIPKMTSIGTFVINGIERAVVTQLVRSPGVFFTGETDTTTGRELYWAELRPKRGSWLEITVGKRNVLAVKIDRRRKMPVTVLLRAFGYSTDEDIKALFAEEMALDEYQLMQTTLDKDTTKSQPEALLELYEKMRPGEPAVLDTAEEYIKQLFLILVAMIWV